MSLQNSGISSELKKDTAEIAVLDAEVAYLMADTALPVIENGNPQSVVSIVANNTLQPLFSVNVPAGRWLMQVYGLTFVSPTVTPPAVSNTYSRFSVAIFQEGTAPNNQFLYTNMWQYPSPTTAQSGLYTVLVISAGGNMLCNVSAKAVDTTSKCNVYSQGYTLIRLSA